MLLTNDVLHGIVAGTVDRVFRRWTRATVRAGGTLKTRVGVLSIVEVQVVERDALTERDAKRAGSKSLATLLALLDKHAKDEDAAIYRIGVRYQGVDPRIDLRAKLLSTSEERAAMIEKLDRLDAASLRGAWTRATLALIAQHPARRAEDLAQMLGYEKKPFKLNVRKLKALGLTESLEIGYRLSPRGESLRLGNAGAQTHKGESRSGRVSVV